MKYTKIIIVIFASLGIIFYAQYPFPALSESIFWASLCLFLFKLLLITIVSKLLFEFVLKKYLKSSYKKASFVSYVITILYCLFDSAKHYLFFDAKITSIPLIPLIAPAIAFCISYFLNKELSISKKQKITLFIILIIVSAFSLFCECHIIFDLNLMNKKGILQ